MSVPSKSRLLRASFAVWSLAFASIIVVGFIALIDHLFHLWGLAIILFICFALFFILNL